MAFSTQKDFMKIDFLNESCRSPNAGGVRRYRASLKTYSSCTDSRAWSLSKENQTKYLQEWVSCGTRFTSEGSGESSDQDAAATTGQAEAQDAGGRERSKTAQPGKQSPALRQPVASGKSADGRTASVGGASRGSTQGATFTSSQPKDAAAFSGIISNDGTYGSEIPDSKIQSSGSRGVGFNMASTGGLPSGGAYSGTPDQFGVPGAGVKSALPSGIGDRVSSSGSPGGGASGGVTFGGVAPGNVIFGVPGGMASESGTSGGVPGGGAPGGWSSGGGSQGTRSPIGAGPAGWTPVGGVPGGGIQGGGQPGGGVSGGELPGRGISDTGISGGGISSGGVPGGGAPGVWSSGGGFQKGVIQSGPQGIRAQGIKMGTQGVGAQGMDTQEVGSQGIGDQGMGALEVGARGMGAQGMGTQGMDAQGMGAQGMGAQGMGAQGIGAKGMGAQGMGAQGMGAQGMGAQGMGAQGMGAQGMGAQGMGAQGMRAQGLGAQGLGAQGVGAQGMGAQGMGAQGMGAQGMGAQGMGAQGMGAQGMGAQGMGAQGMGAQGTGAQGFGIQGIGDRSIGARANGNQRIGTQEIGGRVNEAQGVGAQGVGAQGVGAQGVGGQGVGGQGVGAQGVETYKAGTYGVGAKGIGVQRTGAQTTAGQGTGAHVDVPRGSWIPPVTAPGRWPQESGVPGGGAPGSWSPGAATSGGGTLSSGITGGRLNNSGAPNNAIPSAGAPASGSMIPSTPSFGIVVGGTQSGAFPIMGLENTQTTRKPIGSQPAASDNVGGIGNETSWGGLIVGPGSGAASSAAPGRYSSTLTGKESSIKDVDVGPSGVPNYSNAPLGTDFGNQQWGAGRGSSTTGTIQMGTVPSGEFGGVASPSSPARIPQAGMIGSSFSSAGKSGSRVYVTGSFGSGEKFKPPGAISTETSRFSGYKYPGQTVGLALSGDSLIEAACMKLDEINAVVRENQELKKQLIFSKEKLHSLNQENNKMKTIITDHTAGSLGTIEDEIKVLKARGELTPENVVRVFGAYIEDIKAQGRKADMIKAENESLRQQLAKLEARVQITVLPAEKEVSTDINYLQSMVDELRGEVKQLRAIEEDRARLQMEFDKLKLNIRSIGSPEDLQNMKKTSAALHEVKCDRDRLRSLINSMLGIEDEIRKMRERAERAEALERQLANIQAEQGGLVGDAGLKTEIERLKKEKDEMQQKLDGAISGGSEFGQKDYDKVSCELHLYKIHYNELVNELRRVSCRLFQLEPELCETKRKLDVAEKAISSYERQMDELMDVIRELEDEKRGQKEPTNFSDASQDGHVQDLIEVAKIIIVFIQKETEARRNLENELKACKAQLGQLSETVIIDKCVENERHEEELNDLLKQLETCQQEKYRIGMENNALRGQISNEDLEDLLDQLNACKRENQRLQTLANEGGGSVGAQDFDDLFRELNSCRATMRSTEEENQKLKDQIEELKNLVEACKQENDTIALLEEKQNSLGTCKSRVAELEQQVSKLTQELEDSVNNCAQQIKNMKQQLEKDKSTLLEKVEDVVVIEGVNQADQAVALNKCMEEVEKLKNRFAEETERCRIDKEQLEKQVEKLKADQDNISHTGEAIHSDVSDIEKRLKQCQEANSSLQNERNNLSSQLNECKETSANEIDKLRKEFGDREKDLENDKASLVNQLAEAAAKVDGLSVQLEGQIQEGNSTNEDCEKTKVALRDLTEKYKQLESRYDSLQQHDASIQKALDDLRKEYEAKTLDWTKELNEQKSLLEQAKASLEAQRSEISRLNDILKQGSCKDLEEKLAGLSDENRKLQGENDKLREMVETKQKEVTSLQGKVKSIASALEKCDEQLKNTDCGKYIKEIEDLKASIEKNLAEIQNQATLLDSLRKEVDAAKVAKLNLETELVKVKADKDAANEALKNEVNQLQAQLMSASVPKPTVPGNEELNKCLAEQKRLTEENKRLQDEFRQLEDLVKDIEEERKKNKHLEAMIEELEKKIKDLQNQPTTIAPSTDVNVQSIIDKLKNQLQAETNKNNALGAELQACKRELADCQGELEAQKAGPKTELPGIQSDNLKELESCKAQLEKARAEIAKLSAHHDSDIDPFRSSPMNKDEVLRPITTVEESRATKVPTDADKLPTLDKPIGVDKSPDTPVNVEKAGAMKPAVTETLLAAEKPTVAGTLVAAEKPTVAEKQTVAEKPNVAGKPTVSEKPTVVAKLTVAEKLAVVEKPTVVEKSAADEKPAADEKSAVAEKPAAVEKLTAVEKPTAVETPTVAEKPVAIEKQTVVEKPVVAEMPTEAEKPTINEKPTMAVRHDKPIQALTPRVGVDISKEFKRSGISLPRDMSLGSSIDAEAKQTATAKDKANEMFASTISEIRASHCENLEKMQKMYEERMQDMVKNHDKEIQSLRMTNDALRQMLQDIKAQIASLGGAGGDDPNRLEQINKELESANCGLDKKLNKICTKIIKSSINCLSLRELKYLHCAVYRAGVKMKPATALNSEEIGRCCECTGFVCCLPSIPKDAEKKFIERINCLENELENANDILQRLRNRYESKSGCNRRCCVGYSERGSAPPRGINDAVNQILKCAREGRRNSGV